MDRAGSRGARAVFLDTSRARAHARGAARAQLHETYIVAQTRAGIILVDQHAAHERLVYERLKKERAGAGIARQMLLIPEIVELDALEVDRLIDASAALRELGQTLEPIGPGAVAIREVPAALAKGDIRAIVRDIADALQAAFDVEIDRRKIDLREPIKLLGEYVVPYRPHPDVTIDV
jgi:DNA mismatch repair protein MutL